MISYSKSQIKNLLTPSWFSLLTGVFLSLGLVLIALVIYHLKGSGLSQEIIAFHSVTSGTDAEYQSITNSLSRNPITNNLPLFLFWAGVGLISYFFVMYILKIMHNAKDFEEELKYVNTDQELLIQTALSHALIRLIALIALIACIFITIHLLVPSCLVTIQKVVVINLASSWLKLVALTVALIADSYLQTILLRLLLLKNRVFAH